MSESCKNCKCLTLSKAEATAKKDQSSNYVRYCAEALGVKPTLLAGLLSVTEQTLSNWTEEQILDAKPCKLDRLKALYKVVVSAQKEGLHGKVILNVLNEPIPREKSEKSLLHYIVDEPNSVFLDSAISKVLADFTLKVK